MNSVPFRSLGWIFFSVNIFRGEYISRYLRWILISLRRILFSWRVNPRFRIARGNQVARARTTEEQWREIEEQWAANGRTMRFADWQISVDIEFDAKDKRNTNEDIIGFVEGVSNRQMDNISFWKDIFLVMKREIDWGGTFIWPVSFWVITSSFAYPISSVLDKIPRATVTDNVRK